MLQMPDYVTRLQAQRRLELWDQRVKVELLHIGFGGVIAANRILAVVGPDSAPIRRLIRQAKEKGWLLT